MKQIAEKIARRMIDAGIIQKEKYLAYSYSIQMFLEKMTGMLIIMLLSVLLGRVVEVSIFFFFFANIRKYAGGFHCKTFLSCLILSVVSVLGLSCFVCPILLRNNKWSVVCVALSLLVILVVGAVNHPNMDWNFEEYQRAKRMARIHIIFETAVIMFCYILGTKYLSYMSMGVVFSAITLLLARITRQEVENT